ncbi:PTS ascorbate transporter subunit IIC [Vibrio mediterranei]|uniref:PTS ascorbate transporter subunit IIC n=1 Tax=Vibrio mediterranei TaxID=689 RepID=UPI00148DF980|nr:PTS ascorbate transporter subunit IIC [Vibrio mediterranei]NOI26710.1 PTS ascorbate transporter subunit IIC [Vibrio mediterranei]
MFNFILDLLGNTAILLALITMIGLLLQKNTLAKILNGGLKTLMGFLIMMFGIDVIVKSINYLSAIFEHGLGFEGYISDVSAISGIISKTIGGEIAQVLVLTMMVNVFLARVTKFKYIFLSGQALLWMSTVTTSMLYVNGITGFTMILIASLFSGAMATIMPAICQPIIKEITGGNNVALGHFCSIGYLIQASVAKLLGSDSTSTEKLTLPSKLSFINDSYIAIAVVIIPMYLGLAFLSGDEYVKGFSHGENYLVYSLTQATTFIAGIFILHSGVNLVMNELIPSFKGIASRLVPNAIPALDCPVFFSYMPNAVIIGFISTMIGSIIGALTLPLIHMPIIIPSLLVAFFSGGTAGMFGNVLGGVRGVMIGGIVHGMFITIIPAFIIPKLTFYDIKGITFSDSDIIISGLFFDSTMNGDWISVTLILMLIVLCLLILKYPCNLIKKKVEME